MKNTRLTSLVFGLLPCLVSAAVKTVTWTLPADWEAGAEYRSDPVGAPNVPYYSTRIAVPTKATGIAFEVVEETWMTTDLPRPEAVREPSVVGEPLNEAVESPELYASVYPSATYEQTNDSEEGGVRYLYVRINACRWNGVAQTVEKLAKFVLSVNYTEPRLVRLATAAETAADYIVISPPSFMTYWEDFITYRRSTHPKMKFALVSTADIYAEYDGHDEALKIHHFIEAMYTKGTRYVLLGAGVKKGGYGFDPNTMIPTRYAVTEQARCDSQICDYYYCVVDKPSGAKEVWDYNGDGIYLASRNPNGGYWADATSQFSWTGKMMVHRFSARTKVVLGGKTRTAEEQIRGYVNKLRRAEQGLFPGRFSQAVLAHTLDVNRDTYHGNTSAAITQERAFYDHGANIWSREHGRVIALNEHETRERIPAYMTLKRPIGPISGVNQCYYKPDAIGEILKRDYDSLLINSHGSPTLVEPMERGAVFNATGLSLFYIMCVPCQAGNPGEGSNTDVAISEAAVLNPDGGALVSYANSHLGRWSGKDQLSEKVERDVIKSLYGCVNDGKFHNAGEARLYAQNGYIWNGLSPNSAGGMIVCDSMAYGDPLVSLSSIWSRKVNADGEWKRGDQETVSGQEYATTLTVTAAGADMTLDITNDTGAATLNVNGLGGKTLTIAGKRIFKVSNAVNVDNGNLTFDVPGGFGRNGINFTNGGGKLTIRGNHDGYYGVNFSNVVEMEVAGGGARIDFDAKGEVRNGSGRIAALKFTGAGENTIIAREGGIFSTDFTIPVTGGGTLQLQTQNIGGAATVSATKPLFAVTNATVAVSYNPNWTSENFSRSVWLENGRLESRIDTFGLGPAGSGYPGFDLWVGGSSELKGSNAIRLNGELRLHTFTGGVATVSTELMNGGATGSVRLDAGVVLRMSAANSFSGTLTVPSGARVVVDDAGGLGTGAVRIENGGVLQINQMPLAGVKRVTLESGARLVLGGGDAASYQLYSPSYTIFTMGENVTVSKAGNESTPLEGIVTPEGAYFISSAAKYWGETGVPWMANSNQAIWKKNGAWTTYADGDTVLFKNSVSSPSLTVNTSGTLKPGMMAFQNTSTAYVFEGENTAIDLISLATVGETSFKPSVTASSQVSVGGKTSFSTVTTPLLTVADGALMVTASANGIETFKVVKLAVSSTQGVQGYNYKESAVHALELSEFQLLDSNERVIRFPIGTTIADSEGNTARITGMNGDAYVIEGASSLGNLFDGTCSTYHQFGNAKSGTLTITLSEPLPMFKYFRYGRSRSFSTSVGVTVLTGYSSYPDSNPGAWTLSSGLSEGSLSTVINHAQTWDTKSSSLTGNYTATATSTSKATVNAGAKLYLSGTYNVPLTVSAGAIFAVTNDSVIAFGKGRTLPGGAGSILLDTTEAKKSTSFLKVTSGLNLATDQVVRFAALDDSIAFKIGDDHELYVVTEGVMKAPYSTTIDGSVSWGAAAWKDGDTNDFTTLWSSSIQQPLADINICVTGNDATLNNDCEVSGTTLTLSSAAPVGTFTVSGSGSVSVRTIDASSLQGNLVWGQSLNGADFTAPVGTTTITSATNGGKLTVPEGATVILQGTCLFTEYENDGYIRFEGTYGSKAMSNFATGNVSIKSATLTGALQASGRTFKVRAGDVLNFNGALNSRLDASFDVSGGEITLASGGATTWFGHEGSTTYRQTGGTFTATPNGTAFNGSANGLLLAYSSDGTEPFPVEVYGGVFEVPNSSLNFWLPTTITVATNGLVRAKGVYTGNAQPGTIIVGEGGTFELGSLGIDLGSCTFNLFGGTLAGFEDGAKLQSGINFSGSGTIAAKSGTTFKVLSAISGEGDLTIGSPDYTGTVSLSSLPSEVATFAVAGGTLHLGALRPLDKTLGESAGAIAITLTNAQIKEAQTKAVRIIRATQIPQGGVKVYSSHGHEQSETVAAIDDDGYLTVRTTHDNTVETITDATWNNTGDANTSGVLTGNNFGVCNFTSMTLNFGTNDNMACNNIGNNGEVRIKTIKFLKRDSGTVPPMPTSVTLSQGGKSITGTVSASADSMVVYMNTWPATAGAYYTKRGGCYVLTFDSEETFDTSENLTISFPSQIGLLVLQPKNSLLQYNNWSPVIQIVGDYIVNTGESAEDEPIDAEQLILDFVMTSNDWMKIVYKTVDGGVTNTILSGEEFKFDANNVWRGGGNTISGGAYVHDFTIANGFWNGYPVPNSNLESGGTTNDRYWKIKIPIDLGKRSFAASNLLVKAFITNNGGLTTAQPTANGKTYSVEVEAVNAKGTTVTPLCTANTCILGESKINDVVTACAAEIKSGYLTLKMYRTGAENLTGSFGGVQGLVFTAAPRPSAGPTVVAGEGEVTNLGDGRYSVPTTVTALKGVDPTKVVVKAYDHDITGVFTVTGDAATGVTIALSSDPTASVAIGGEAITLEPVLTAIDEGEHGIEAPFVVGDTAAVGVRTIPGLTYKLLRGTALGAGGSLTDETVVHSKRAEGTRLRLEDQSRPAREAFYRIRVGVGAQPLL